jgi:hypothetical protein
MVKLHGKYAKGEERNGELLSCLAVSLDGEEDDLDVEGHGTDEEGDHREWGTGWRIR